MNLTLNPHAQNRRMRHPTTTGTRLAHSPARHNQLSLACHHGCAWKTLSWSGQSATDVFINAMGMVGGDNQEENSTFLVAIHAADDKMELSCKRGCAWKELSYWPLSSRRRIDESGVFGTDN